MPPRFNIILCGILGNGFQFIFLIFIVSLFGFLGLYYNHKGDNKQIGLFIYAFTGAINGYFSGKYFKYLGGQKWALNLLFSCNLFPISLLSVFSVVNSYAWAKQSTSAIPAEAVFIIVLLYTVVYIPMNIAGTITARI